MTRKPKTPARLFIKEWRDHRVLTLERLSERLEGIEGTSSGNLSRIERGEVPYNRAILEGLAEALDCEPADLLGRHPEQPEHTILTLVKGMSQDQKRQALAIIKALAEDAAEIVMRGV